MAWLLQAGLAFGLNGKSSLLLSFELILLYSIGTDSMAYEPKKAAELISYLILKSGGTELNVLKVMKLVYLVDRESIARFGFPVLDEVRVSMRHGPVNSTTYEYIKGECDTAGTGWSDLLRDRENHEIGIANTSISVENLEELSQADLECANAVWNKFGHLDAWQLRDWTHDPRNVPEWEDPKGGSNEIPLQRILNAVGVKDAEKFAEASKAFGYIDKAFSAARVQ